jgi:hypothetical protein
MACVQQRDVFNLDSSRVVGLSVGLTTINGCPAGLQRNLLCRAPLRAGSMGGPRCPKCSSRCKAAMINTVQQRATAPQPAEEKEVLTGEEIEERAMRKCIEKHERCSSANVNENWTYPPERLQEAYERCGVITEDFAKTFYLGTQLMAPEKARAVWAIYVWCRRTDELVDGPNADRITPQVRTSHPLWLDSNRFLPTRSARALMSHQPELSLCTPALISWLHLIVSELGHGHSLRTLSAGPAMEVARDVSKQQLDSRKYKCARHGGRSSSTL